MPNRWLKEAYCASPRIAAVAAEARDLWVRLVVKADDHGYFHGSAQLVASACFPLQPNARKCEQLLAELASAQLIVRYESGGKDYLAITQWYERPRSAPKYPPPPDSQAVVNSREQVQAIASPHVHDHVHDQTTATATTTVIAPNEKISFDAAKGWLGITDLDRETWKEAFPAVDLAGELAKARVWVIANPTKKKSNWRKFLTSWFSRRQDEGPKQHRGNGRTPTLAERRSNNLADITGRSTNERTVSSDPLGGTVVRPALGDLRQQDDDDVGRLPKG